MGRKAANMPPHGSPGQRLRTLLESLPARRRPSIGELADAADVSPSRLSDILNNRTENPGIATIERILSALGKTFCDYHKAGE